MYLIAPEDVGKIESYTSHLRIILQCYVLDQKQVPDFVREEIEQEMGKLALIEDILNTRLSVAPESITDTETDNKG